MSRSGGDGAGRPLTIGTLLAVFLTAFQAGSALAQQAEPDVAVSLERPYEYNLGNYAKHVGHLFRRQDAELRIGSLVYAIRYCACVDKAHSPQVSPLEGYIGMPQPNACNWYHGGFLNILLNGHDIGTTPLSSMLVSQRGARGELDLVWHDKLADVRLRFLAQGGSDALWLETAIEPRHEVTSVALLLRCYPSFFTAAHRRQGARRIQTPVRVIKQDQRATLAAKDAWWSMYYDEVFDVAKGEGEGPCALLILPEEARQIAYDPGSYAVATQVTYPPSARRLHLALWDFKGLPNADAITRIRAEAQATRTKLATADFTPASLKTFDLAGLRAAVQRSMASPQIRAMLGKKVSDAQAWLQETGPTSDERPENLGILAQEEFLKTVHKYEDFVWELKLAELLSSF